MGVYRRAPLTFLAAIVAIASLAGTAEAQRLKVHISVDMEGLTGVVSGDQLSPASFEYARFREIMTQEANAAVQAAIEAGATEVVVADSHGSMQNLLVEKLPKNVTIVRGPARPLGMMQGIDDTFDAAIFIGYHSSTTNSQGIRAHTISSASLTDIRINGKSMPEAGLNAAIAGHFNVPVVMISGDDVIVKEAQDLLGPIEGAIVKWAYGFHSARTLTPEAGLDQIRDKVKRGIAKRRELRAYKPGAPVRLEIQFKNYRPPEMLSLLPGVERIDSHAVRFTARDILEASRFLTFVTTYNIALEP